MLGFCCKHFLNSFSLLWWLSLWVEFLTHTNTPIRALLWYNSLVLWSAVFVCLAWRKAFENYQRPQNCQFFSQSTYRRGCVTTFIFLFKARLSIGTYSNVYICRLPAYRLLLCVLSLTLSTLSPCSVREEMK